MALGDAGEDHVAQRQRRIERLCRAAAGIAQRLVAGPADLALPPRRRVQAQRQGRASQRRPRTGTPVGRMTAIAKSL
jgi:hypothetical protein